MLAQNFHRNGALPGDHVRVVKGVNKGQPLFFLQGQRMVVGVGVALTVQQHLTAQHATDEAKAHAEGTRPNYESAVRAAEEAWMEVICAYWRGFSLVRPDEQPDIDAINRLTNAPRRIHLDEVVA